jgi:arginine/lysine/ornithine decarboxylase
VTGRVEQERAPLFDRLTEYARGGIYPLHTPGHKGGRFADVDLANLVGRQGLALDLPGMTATDNTFHPTGCIRDAQRLASDLVGADATFFLAAGSTLGVAAALLASVPPGETVALPRNIHRSVVAGLVLGGARPRFIAHDVLSECGALGVSRESVAAALDGEPRPAAVLLTRPSYYGLARDLVEVAALCHDRQVPLIVDEAHGAHFAWLPAGGPQPALAAGADIAIQSWHKTLGSLVGSAMLHVGRDSLIGADRVQDALNFLQTTSPSLLLLASLDLVRRRLWRDGERLFAEAVRAVRELENRIDDLPGLRVLRPEADPRLAGHRRDPLRLVVNVTETGWTGYDVERHLRLQFQVEDEMADWFNVVYILSPEDDPAASERLVAGLKSVSQSPRLGSATQQFVNSEAATQLLQPPIPPLAMLPREAALAEKQTIPLSRAAGQVCAEMVMFYPPGIPLLMPGELIAEETFSVCQQLLAAGAHPYASDTTLETVRVVKSRGGA